MAANLTKAEQYTEELKIAKRHASQLAALSPEARARVRILIFELLVDLAPGSMPVGLEPNGQETDDKPAF